LGFGIDGTGHLCGEALKAAASIDIVHVPYKGDAPAAADVMGGQLQCAFVSVASATAPMQRGKVRIVAVAHDRRVSSLPEVPTTGEAGYSDVVFSQWYAIFSRAGTPQASIDRLSRAMKAILAKPVVRTAMATQGAESAYTTPDELSQFCKSEIARFRGIIQRLGIKVA
jgi:tripartite-type tricarboxylate transporter receptor subunit TctC